ncbi:fibrinogen-like protein 1 isoform X2 [Toxorhynchites rutilus septentrionalis]|uniref:fibrinogen-like protein 1 isoform X2 n=1 Tax=Toxorhynchites rutilus septentrionalis TaxID=329112 RepID=UPI00247AFB91|nr:fibrinogen-like protein 1 isoform X2 [Toxorhynchites rutilus septentrionalis]
MKMFDVFISTRFANGVLSLVIFCFVGSCSVSSNSTELADNMGFGFELILAKLEHLEHKMNSMNELLIKMLPTRENPRNTRPASTQRPYTRPLNTRPLETRPPKVGDSTVYRFCSEVPVNNTAIYLIQPSERADPFNARCVTNYDGEGWTIIQHRNRGSENFNRSWVDYKNGFGILEGEFWFGLDKIHLLTSSRMHEISFYLEDKDGLVRTARYDLFAIGDESEGYALKAVGRYSGTAGNVFHPQLGTKFTTYDRDNDLCPTNCAQDHGEGWWYTRGHRLNRGQLLYYGDSKSIWMDFRSQIGLDMSTIMIREISF